MTKHTHARHQAHVARLAVIQDPHARKAAAFETIQQMIIEGIADCKALGATDAMMQPFTDGVAVFKQTAPEWMALHLA